MTLDKGAADKHIQDYSEVYPCPLHSTFGSSTPEVACAKDFATRWLFELSPRAREIGKRVRERGRLVDNDYVGLHIRTEKLRDYGCATKACDCRTEEVLREIIQVMPTARQHLDMYVTGKNQQTENRH